MKNKIEITIIGLGYVGLPLLKALSNYYTTQGVDSDRSKVQDIINNKIDFENCSFIKKNSVNLYTKLEDAKNSKNYIICVPTPINKFKKPDLKILINVLKQLSRKIKKNDFVIFESTYYPGLTWELSKKYLERKSFLINRDFYIGYSPERINPGDKVNNLSNTFKLISASNKNKINYMKKIYGKICKNIHVCNSIEIAEMSKIIENVQRDINIAFINEILLICNKINLPFNDVYKAAKTKWNFLNFYPGLVGGHCISVDTYYLKHLTNKKRINTQIIDSGRSINEKMVIFFKSYVDSKFAKINRRIKILFLGYSFKENVSDLRNSKNLELFNLFRSDLSYISEKFDPIVEKKNIYNFFKHNINKYDCIYIAVPHTVIADYGHLKLFNHLNKSGFIFDPKNLFSNFNHKKLITI